MIHRIYDFAVYLPYLSSLFALMGSVLAGILYRESGKQRKMAESHDWMNIPLMFVLGCWFVSIVIIAAFGVLSTIKWFGLFGL